MKDFIEVTQERMDAMSHEELKRLVLVSINHLGLEMNGQDYTTPQEAIECLGNASQIIFGAYDEATLMSESNTHTAGTS